MPFKSKKQMKKFAQMVRTGEITQSTFDKWTEETDMGNLPEEVTQVRKSFIRKKREMRGTR